MLKKDGVDAVYSALAPMGEATLDIVVKVHGAASIRDRIRALAGSTRLRRQRLGAQILQRAGIATAAPLAAGISSDDTGRPSEWLALESVPGVSLLEALHHATPERATGLASQLGELIGQMVTGKSPVFNRDQKPSNIIVSTPGELVVVDTVGVRALAAMPRERAVARMVASALIEPAGCGVRLPKTFAANILAGLAPSFDPVTLARVAAMVSSILREHGDPTPRINPLG